MSGTGQKVKCGGLWEVLVVVEVVMGGVESNFSVHRWSKTRTLTLTYAQAEQFKDRQSSNLMFSENPLQ